MNTTTNYGLKLYEGTDLFNPLTVENVNAGDIDTAMKAISDHSVGAATELTTGTVHAITRADADRNVFLFVATSNFTAGDTFTLDGDQVSALTPDGQQLATGSYVIGSSVLCALHDTLITVYVNPAKAKDADMLDGHDSSYYATDSDLDTVAGTIQAVSDKVGTAVLTTTAPDCSGAINELNTHLSANKRDSYVDLTGETLPYIIPKDGYLYVQTSSTQGAVAQVTFNDSDGNLLGVLTSRTTVNGQGTSSTTFVKAGMKVSNIVNTSNSATAYIGLTQ